MTLARVTAILLAMLASARVGEACACVVSAEPKTDAEITKQVEDELGKAIAVFIGRVTERDELTVTFEVDAVWKGELGPSYTMSSGAVANADGTFSISSCDFNFARGRWYLVFAVGKTLPEAKAMSCTHTSEMRYAMATLPHLDKLAKRRGPR